MSPFLMSPPLISPLLIPMVQSLLRFFCDLGQSHVIDLAAASLGYGIQKYDAVGHHIRRPPLSSVLPGTAPAVDAVLARGLSKEPADRFSSCGAFVAALGAALALPRPPATAPH